MGYTHYYSNRKNLPSLSDEAQKKIQEILRVYSPTLVGNTENDKPVATAEMVVFNGKEAGETFHWDRHETWACCKTGRKPYDIVVCLVLLALKEEYGNDFCFSSDGALSEWTPTMQEARSRFQIVSRPEWLVKSEEDLEREAAEMQILLAARLRRQLGSRYGKGSFCVRNMPVNIPE